MFLSSTLLPTRVPNKSHALLPRIVPQFGQHLAPNEKLNPPQTIINRTVYEGTTGGTIDMVKHGDGPRMPSQQNGSVIEKMNTRKQSILPESEGRQQKARFLSFSVFGKPTDSSSITRDLQGKLVSAVVEKIKADPSAAVLITHGTDTLMEDAALLSYQKLPAPIVLTGSWASAGETGSDAQSNILRARRLASQLDMPGVFAVIGNDIIQGTQLNKIRTNPFAGPYFVGLTDRPFGSFDDQHRIQLNPNALKDWQAILAKRSATQSHLNPIQPAYVEHLVFHRETPGVVFQQLAQRLQRQSQPSGAIIEGELSQHPQAAEILGTVKELAQKGIYVITTSQAPLEEERPYHIGTIPPIHLRSKLAALLGRATQSDTLHNELASNMAGEVLTPQQARAAWLKLPTTNPADALIVATPSLDVAEIDDAIARLKKNSPNKTGRTATSQDLLIENNRTSPKLIFIGYGDGHIPIGIDTMKERLLKQNPKESNQAKDLWPRFIEFLETEGQQKPSGTDYSVNGIYHHLTRFLNGDAVQAKTLLKEKLIKSHPILTRIGNALDAGLDVRMTTKLPYATANLSSYEIGTILQFIGVRSL